MRRALLGGTFDPPHIAHLLAGEAALRQLDVDAVTFVPAGDPWQKAQRRVSAARDRWSMTELAVEGILGFQADDREVRRAGWSYTIDTVETFGGDDLVLVLGADAAAGIQSWHRAEGLLERVEVAVAPRPGTDRDRVEEAVGGPVVWLDIPLLDVSGTDIRERMRQGRPVRFLMRDTVWRYAVEHGLYTDGPIPGDG